MIIMLSYDEVGDVIVIEDFDGVVLMYIYDGVWCLIDIIDGVGNYIYYMLDVVGNCIKEEIFDSLNMFICLVFWMFMFLS